MISKFGNKKLRYSFVRNMCLLPMKPKSSHFVDLVDRTFQAIYIFQAK